MEVEASKSPRSLITTLAIVFAFMSVAMILISGGFGIFFLIQSQQDAIAGKQQVVAHQAANAVAGFIQEKFSVLEATVKLTRPGKELHIALDALLGLQPAFRQVLLFNTENKRQFTATRLSQAASQRIASQLGTDPFAKVEHGERYIGSVYVDQVSSEPLVVMAVPVTDILGDSYGMLVAEVNLKFMWDLVDRLKVGETGHAFVVDREGYLIAFGDTGRVLRGEKLDYLQDVADFMRNPVREDETGGNIFSGINGNLVVGTYVPLKTPDWAVMTELPANEAYRPIVRSAVASAGIMLVMALLAGLIGVVVARRLAAPILNLTATATRIADGEIGLQAMQDGPTEVARLAGAFNHMTERLRVMLDAEEERTVRLEREVEQRKKAEAALIESGSILHASLESTDDGVLVVDEKGMVSHFNSRFNEIWSIPEDVLATGEDDLLIDSVLAQLVDPEQFVAKVRELYQSSLRSEDTLHFKDGRIIDRFSYPLVRDGRESGRVWFFRDTTERRKAVEELRKLRNYLASIINSMPSVLVGVDVEGRVTQWNKQAELATGLTVEEALSRPLVDAFPRLKDQMGLIQQAIEKGQVIKDPRISHVRQGRVRFEEVTIFPLIAKEVEGAVIRVDDVTERIHLEEMMIQSEKMLSVGGLAAGMAHEINNPLAGILQSTAVLKNRLLGDMPANQEAAEAAGTTMAAIGQYMELRKLSGMLDSIHASGDRAATIVRNMLGFARKSDRVVSNNDLGDLLDQSLELVRTDYDMKKRYDFKQIQIVRHYDNSIAPVPCEAGKLQQVFLNILKNGAEAMTEVGRTSNPPMFTLRVLNDDSWVRVEIEDNGPGMDERTRRSVFEPFFTTKPVGRGTGLGLSVAYFIVTEDHGGEMSVHAADGGGTRFVMRLPMAGVGSPPRGPGA